MTQDTFAEKPEREMASLRSRIAGEYREMPGLSLTLAQAARLWGLDRATTERVLESLSETNVLSRTRDGIYRLS
jgi:DNA-binding IclR family transcriptional regulator